MPVKRTLRSEERPILLVVDGESKTAKTTGTKAICMALERQGLRTYEADAGAFYRRLTVCVLEDCGITDLDHSPVPELGRDQLYKAIHKVIAQNAALADRNWPSLASVVVEKYVSIVGNTSASQDAMEEWYERLVEIATHQSIDALVLNARNPRMRLASWKQPVLEILVYCEPREAGRRILYARGNTSPSVEELNFQAAAIAERRQLDRTRAKYPFVDAPHIVVCKTTGDLGINAQKAVQRSWEVSEASNQKPATIQFDTTYISLSQTEDGIIALANAAIDYIGFRKK